MADGDEAGLLDYIKQHIKTSENCNTVNFQCLMKSLLINEYNELVHLSRSLPRDDDHNRKLKLVQYFSLAKNRIIQLIVLAKFSENDMNTAKTLYSLCTLFNSFSNKYMEVANRLSSFVVNILYSAKVPFIGLDTILEPSKYFPTCYYKMFIGDINKIKENNFDYIDIGDSDLSSVQSNENIALKLKIFVKNKIIEADYEIPEYDLLRIDDKGILECSIEYRYSVKLAYLSLKGPWSILTVNFLFPMAIESNDIQHYRMMESQELHLINMLNEKLNHSTQPLMLLYTLMNELTDCLIIDLLMSQLTAIANDLPFKHVSIVEYNQSKSIKFSLWRSPLLSRTTMNSIDEFMAQPHMTHITSTYSATQLRKDRKYYTFREILKGNTRLVTIEMNKDNGKDIILTISDDKTVQTFHYSIENGISAKKILKFCMNTQVYNIIDDLINTDPLLTPYFKYDGLSDSRMCIYERKTTNLSFLNFKLVLRVDENSGFFIIKSSSAFCNTELQKILDSYYFSKNCSSSFTSTSNLSSRDENSSSQTRIQPSFFNISSSIPSSLGLKIFELDSLPNYCTKQMIIDMIRHIERYSTIEMLKNMFSHYAHSWSIHKASDSSEDDIHQRISLAIHLYGTPFSVILTNLSDKHFFDFHIYPTNDISEIFGQSIHEHKAINEYSLLHHGRVSISMLESQRSTIQWLRDIHRMHLSQPLLKSLRAALNNHSSQQHLTKFLNTNGCPQIVLPLTWIVISEYPTIKNMSFFFKFITLIGLNITMRNCNIGENSDNAIWYQLVIVHNYKLYQFMKLDLSSDTDKLMSEISNRSMFQHRSVTTVNYMLKNNTQQPLFSLIKNCLVDHIELAKKLLTIKMSKIIRNHMNKVVYYLDKIELVLAKYNQFKIYIYLNNYEVVGPVTNFHNLMLTRLIEWDNHSNIIFNIMKIVNVIGICESMKGYNLEIEQYSNAVLKFSNQILLDITSDKQQLNLLVNRRYFLVIKLDSIDSVEIEDFYARKKLDFIKNDNNKFTTWYESFSLLHYCFGHSTTVKELNYKLRSSFESLWDFLGNKLLPLSHTLTKVCSFRPLLIISNKPDVSRSKYPFVVISQPTYPFLHLQINPHNKNFSLDCNIVESYKKYLNYLLTSNDSASFTKVNLFLKLMLKSNDAIIKWLCPLIDYEMSMNSRKWTVEWTDRVPNIVATTSPPVKNNFIFIKKVVAKIKFVRNDGEKFIYLVFAHDFEKAISTCFLWKESIDEAFTLTQNERQLVSNKFRQLNHLLDPNFTLNDIISPIIDILCNIV